MNDAERRKALESDDYAPKQASDIGPWRAYEHLHEENLEVEAAVVTVTWKEGAKEFETAEVGDVLYGKLSLDRWRNPSAPSGWSGTGKLMLLTHDAMRSKLVDHLWWEILEKTDRTMLVRAIVEKDFWPHAGKHVWKPEKYRPKW